MRAGVLRPERVTAAEIASLDTFPEPLHALLRGAVRERLRHHVALALFLQTVVANGRRRIQCLLDVALFQHLTAAVGVVAPEAGEAVGLQFLPDRHGVRIGLAQPALRGTHLLADPQQGLHMVANLVCNHVGLREVTRGAMAAFQVFEKGKIDIHLLVGRAVKRSHGGTGHAARRLHRAGEQHQIRFLVVTSGLLEDGVPGIFGIGQHHRDKVGQLFLFRCWLIRGLRDRRPEPLLDLQQHLRVNAEKIAQRQGNHDGTDATLEGHPPSAPAALVLDIGTSTALPPAHCHLLQEHNPTIINHNRRSAAAATPVAVYCPAVFSHYSGMDSNATASAQPEKPRRSGFSIFLIVLATVVVTAALTFWIVRTYIFPAEFKPVELSEQEEQVLNAKLERLDTLQTRRTRGTAKAAQQRAAGEAEMLEPEAYSEAGADRSITLSERELNGLLSKNTDLARKLAIDLSKDLLSAKLLVPVDEDFPIMGGQILKVRAGMELAYRNNRPVVILKGVSVMGVPIPNAWLGGMKNIDLIEYYGNETGFWKAFADGVDNIRIEDGHVTMVLKE